MHRYAVHCVAVVDSCKPTYQPLAASMFAKLLHVSWFLLFVDIMASRKERKEGVLPTTTAREMPSAALPFKWWKPEFIWTFQFVLAAP